MAASNPVDSLGLWQPFPSSSSAPINQGATQISRFATFSLDLNVLQSLLSNTPKESSPTGFQGAQIITLPTSDGKFQRFQIVESSVMAPELAAKFPEIKTYRGQGIDDPAATVRLDLTPAGFHAQVLSPSGTFYIDPQSTTSGTYISYYKRDAIGSPLVESSPQVIPQSIQPDPTPSGTDPITNLISIGTQLRTYSIAVAATGEYTAFHGGTVPLGLSAVVTAINRQTGIYEKEVATRFQLVANNNLLIYTNAVTDPYTNFDAFALLDENQANVDAVIGNANYDIGHVFSTGGGGLAFLGVVGVSGFKAQGETGSPTPTGDAFWVDYVAHEIGHQFGANHSFNANDLNRNSSTAFEPGSGSSIMAYAGIIAGSNLQSNTDIPAYFHSGNFDEITDLITTGAANTAATITNTGNSIPTINAGINRVIPARTPFALTATGSDANGDTLTYAWEEIDLGPAQNLPLTDNGSSPLFRSFSPTLSPTRFFPRLTNILNNNNVATTIPGGDAPGELLPTTTRNLNFRVTARDNRSGGGGVNSDNVLVQVVNTGAPFQVTSQNTAVTWTGGSSQTVTWNVAGTTAAPISAANVNIFLSTDGGNTFPTILIANTPNDGTQTVTVPNLSTANARVKVQAAGNIFFDISNVNFTINSNGNQNIVGTAANDTLTGGAGNDTIAGLGGQDSLSGLGGNDSLNGGLGIDTMVGGLGNDIYVRDNAGDIVTETSALGGIDVVQSSVTYGLGVNLESLTLTGAAVINGSGNALNNILNGNGAANILNGGIGLDTLTGGLGNDFLIGGAGSDRLTSGTPNDSDIFRFNNIAERIDTFTDFDRVDNGAIVGDDRDRIQVVNTGFNPTGGASDLVNGVLPAARFVNGAGGLGALSGFRYFQGTGQLFFDSNGGTHDVGVGSLLLATLTSLPTFASMAGGITVI